MTKFLRPFSGVLRIPNAAMIYQAAIDQEVPLAESTELTRLRSGDPAILFHSAKPLPVLFLRAIVIPAILAG